MNIDIGNYQTNGIFNNCDINAMIEIINDTIVSKYLRTSNFDNNYDMLKPCFNCNG